MLTRTLAGKGRIEPTTDGWRLHLGPTTGYIDAQLDDTQGRSRRKLLHQPPVRLTLEARASSPAPGGTLGFGFWNDPFPAWGGQSGARRLLPASPQALWFFYASPPSELPFSRGGPGSGWTAAAYQGPTLPGWMIAAMGAAGFAGMAIASLRARLLSQYWRWFKGSQSPPLGGLDAWHAYQIDWREETARFVVDDHLVLETHRPTPGPLGLVIWIDNQWAALSETAGLQFGVLPSQDDAWLEIRSLRLDGAPLPVRR
jgi:hypothetical protein